MRVTCSSCSANYTIADDKVRNKHVKLRCKKCGSTIVVDGTSAGDSSSGAGLGTSAEAVSLTPVAGDASSDLWTVNLSDEDEREMTFDQVVNGYLDGTVTDDAFLWKEGMSDWMPVMAVPEFQRAIDAARAKGKSSPKAAMGSSPLAARGADTAPGTAAKSSPIAAASESLEGIGAASKPVASQASSEASAGAVGAATKSEAKIGAKVGSAKVALGTAKASAAKTPTATTALKGASTSSAAADGRKGRGSIPAPQKLATGTKQAAIGGNKPPGGKQSTVADLFSAAAKAGGEDDAAAAAAAAPAYGGTKSASPATHNENSVLFSLDALKAGFAASGSVPKPQTVEPRKTSLDAIMSIPGPANPTGVLGFGTADLLTAPAPPPPPEPVKPKVVQPEPKAIAAELPPPAPPASGKRKLLIAAIALLGLAGVGGLVVSNLGAGEEQQKVAELEARQKELEEKLRSERKAAKEAEEEAARAKEAAVAAAKKEPVEAASSPDKAAAADDKAKEDATKVASSRSVGVGASTRSTRDEAKPDKPTSGPTPRKEPASVTVSNTPSSGVSTFDKGAARSALSVAASGAAGCKKAGGPTGSGRVMVTFVPSGRVTSANVVGAPFAGTSVGSCVATIFRRATVPAFSGDPVTVAKSFSIQ